MRREKPKASRFSFAEHKTDLIFAAVALILVLIMTILLFQYLGLREQNQTPPEEYGIILQELSDIKAEKSNVESEIDQAIKELEDLNKEIADLQGK